MRYVILVLVNLPVILLALVGLITKYKLGRITPTRFRHQIILWTIILIVLIGSFPLYNYLVGQPLLDSRELSLFDIAQTTAITFLLYVCNDLRQKIEQNDKKTRDLHQELSIELSHNEKPQ